MTSFVELFVRQKFPFVLVKSWFVREGEEGKTFLFNDTYTASQTSADAIVHFPSHQQQRKRTKNRGMTEHEHISLHFYVHMTSFVNWLKNILMKISTQVNLRQEKMPAQLTYENSMTKFTWISVPDFEFTICAASFVGDENVAT
jgi:hypothetical protein